ncbi:MAG: signal transduction histidine kinase [Benniella sp.]|nr:MAG: signal transduction histidine kinase [Benniella sp.]
MGKFYESIGDDHAKWILEQKLFFVATAPLDPQGTVNASPKGYDTLRIMGPNQVCYLDLTGSGIETQSHLQQNGRITFLFMSFGKGPRILRLFGRGRVAQVDTPEYKELYAKYFARPAVSETQPEEDSSISSPASYELEGASQIRSIIVADIHKVGTSCGWAVPYYQYLGERPTLQSFWGKMSRSQLGQYWAMENTQSVDGLLGMRHELMGPEWAPAPETLRAIVYKKATSIPIQDLVRQGALVLAGFGAGLAVSRLFR